MAEDAASQPGGQQRIDIKVLSPGETGVPETILINDVPISTTVAALKQRISIIAPSRPPPESQRLIYKGHLLAEPTATMEQVFGSEQIRIERMFTIHLVVRHAGHSSTSSHGQPLPRPSSIPAAGGPFARPQPQTVHIHAPVALPFAPPAGAPQFLPGTPNQQTPSHPLAAQGQPAGDSPSNTSNAPGPVPIPQFGRPGFNPNPQTFGQLVAQQQAQRAANGQQGVGTGATPTTEPPAAGSPAASSPQTATGPAQPRVQIASTQLPMQTAPDGTRFQMTVNEASFAMPLAQAMQMAAQQQMAQQHYLAHQQAAAQQQYLLAQQHAAAQRQYLAAQQQAGQQPTQPQGQTQNQAGSPATPGGPAPQSTAESNPTQRQSSPGVSPLRPAVMSPAAGLQPASIHAASPTIYLLSSPAGPQALVLTPQGAYNSSPIATPHPLSAVATPSILRNRSPAPTRPAGQTAQQDRGNREGHAPQDQGQLARPQPRQNANRPQEMPAANAGNVDLLGPIQPLLAHLWFLLRVLLFAYFFLGSGQGWRRPLVLLGICVAFFVLRGVDAGAGLREAVRGWWEGVIGVAPQPAAGAGGQAAENQAARNIPNNDNTQNNDAALPQPGPTGAANADVDPARPIQPAQQDEDLSPLRARLRPVERLFALFVASLWPGVGERTVRARQEQDERLNRQREEEAQAQRQITAAAESGEEAGPSGAVTESETAPMTSQDTNTIGAASSGIETAPVEESSTLRERKKQDDHAVDPSTSSSLEGPSREEHGLAHDGSVEGSQ